MTTDANSSNKLPRIAVIGSGYWGKNLVRNFHQIGALDLICDRSEDLLANFREQYSGVKTCLALSEVLKDATIDGVAIATPAETHYGLAKEALLAGKHVYVEKPLVLNEREGEELIELARERKLVLMVGHLLQYHPIFKKLKELALGGELGRINYIYSNRLNLGKIRREENILWSFAPHDISMILSLAEDEPETVQTTGGYYLHKKIADVTTTHFEFKSGLQAHIFVSWLHPFKEQKLVVVGDRKMAVFNDTKPWADKLWLYPHEIKWEHNMPVPAKAEPETVDVPQEEPLRQECLHFLHCVATGQQPVTDGKEGLRVLRVLNASQRSLDLNGQSVRILPQMEQQDQRSDPVPQIDFFAHESAVIDEGVSVGKGTKIWHFSHVLKGSDIGENCNIGQNVVVGPDVTIGNGCKIQNNVSVYKGVTLEDGVFCGPSMVFTNIYNPRAEIRKMDQVRPTLVKKGATLGANSTIVCGTTIGRYAFVGAGAVVNKNVVDHALVVGNPAKQIGWACECGERLSNDMECLVCEKRYERSTGGLIEIR
ncbi:Gfo/Idh/MocA family oxidoreductase [uncultured Desulfosarcina sp.]|uniref:Gfo/Idh/MocA family oxidoreductase n=1 Tax=uncultured Desulfosarcina sp. TaxID=218289 RepID=UPI0029C89652|nr:Gfo/Idh/MocA family oxidoreductase [uncultured Desulfosarcina sp.]